MLLMPKAHKFFRLATPDTLTSALSIINGNE